MLNAFYHLLDMVKGIIPSEREGVMNYVWKQYLSINNIHIVKVNFPDFYKLGRHKSKGDRDSSKRLLFVSTVSLNRLTFKSREICPELN